MNDVVVSGIFDVRFWFFVICVFCIRIRFFAQPHNYEISMGFRRMVFFCKIIAQVNFSGLSHFSFHLYVFSMLGAIV